MNWKTSWPKKEDIKREWWIVDAEGEILGRLASEVAKKLMGKDKVGYEKSVDLGDHVIVLNAKKIKVTGGKKRKKVYHWHTPYPGGIKSMELGEMLKRKPARVIELAVKRMLPSNKHKSRRMARLHVYAEDQHKHAAQKPKKLEINQE